MFRVMGVDPSTSTGVAVVDFGDTAKLFQVRALRELCANRCVGVERAERIGSNLGKVVNEFNPNVVVIEGYGFKNKNTLVTMVEIGTMIRHFIRKADVRYLEVPPKSLKKFVANNGNADKTKMSEGLWARWAIAHTNHNIVDALGLAFFGGGLARMFPTTVWEAAALSKVSVPYGVMQVFDSTGDLYSH